MQQTAGAVIAVANIFLLVFSTFNLFRRKHIINLLVSFSVLSVALLEFAKFSWAVGFLNADMIFGLGFCMLPLLWLTLSVSLIPARHKNTAGRLFVLPVLGFISLVFMVIWWVRPFVHVGVHAELAVLPKIAKYFFMFLILALALALANIERSIVGLRQKRLWLLLVSAVCMLAPYIVLAAHAVSLGEVHVPLLWYSSVGVLAGGIVFLFASREGFSLEAIKEETAVNASLVLFLVGGYLFFIGAFIKLFQMFGWNLQTLFSFLTSFFIAFILIFLVLASSLKERVKSFLLRNFTRQKYDWLKIWEDFTYRISFTTSLPTVVRTVKESLSRTMGVYGVEVLVFEKEPPFEAAFCDWMLRRAEAFSIHDLKQADAVVKYPVAHKFLHDKHIELVMPLYGQRAVIGLIGLQHDSSAFLDKELLKVLSLQASSVIVNCRAYRQLRAAEKKESLYRLSTFIVHDMKNFVNALSILASNKDKFAIPAFQQDAVRTIESTVSKMKHLIDEFKALRGDMPVQKRRCAVSELVRRVLDDSGVFLRQNITIDIAGIQELAAGADADLLYKVVLNLVLNALEAMPNGGTLTVACQEDAGYAEIRVGDSGCGMSHEFMDTKLFTAFASTKPDGLGIGLYQCRIIVEAHGGTISAQSRPQEGATFFVRIPL